MRRLYPQLWQDCIGAWHPGVDRSRSTLLTDFSGYGRHGTLTNMDPATDWVATEKGIALDFDGSNDRVNVDGVTTIDALTVSAWCVTTVSGSVRMIVNKDDGSNPREWQFRLSSSGKLEFVPQAAGANTSTARSINDGTWHHVAATVGPDKRSLRLYIDGTQDGSRTFTGDLAFGSDRLNIGTYLDGNNGFVWNGQITDVRIYNRALTPSEIALLARRPGIAYETARVAYVRRAAGGGVSTGFGTVSGVGLLTGAGTTNKSGSGSITSVGLLTGVGSTVHTGSGSIDSVGLLTGTGSATHYGSGSIDSVGLLTGTGLASHYGSGEVSGIGLLTGVGSAPVVGSASGFGSVIGVGLLTGTGSAVHSGSGEISSVGVLSGTGLAPTVGDQSGSGTITSTSSLQGVGRAVHSGSSSLTATSSFSGTGSAPVLGSASGSGTFTATSLITGVGLAIHSGSSSVLAIPSLTGAGASTSSGSGSVSATPSLSGAGNLSGQTTTRYYLLLT